MILSCCCFLNIQHLYKSTYTNFSIRNILFDHSDLSSSFSLMCASVCVHVYVCKPMYVCTRKHACILVSVFLCVYECVCARLVCHIFSTVDSVLHSTIPSFFTITHELEEKKYCWISFTGISGRFFYISINWKIFTSLYMVIVLRQAFMVTNPSCHCALHTIFISLSIAKIFMPLLIVTKCSGLTVHNAWRNSNSSHGR